jgi:hypothetical protein
VSSTCVIDQELIDNQGPTLFERGICLADQHTFRWQIPVVQDHSYHQDVGPWQIIGEEIARRET